MLPLSIYLMLVCVYLFLSLDNLQLQCLQSLKKNKKKKKNTEQGFQYFFNASFSFVLCVVRFDTLSIYL